MTRPKSHSTTKPAAGKNRTDPTEEPPSESPRKPRRRAPDPLWGSYTLTLSAVVAGMYVESLRAFIGAVVLQKSLFSAHALVFWVAPYGVIVAVSATALLWLRPWTRRLGLVTVGLVAVTHVVLAAVHPNTARVVEAGVYAVLCFLAGRYLLSKDMAEMEQAPAGHQTKNLRALHVSLVAFGLFSLAGLVAIALEPYVHLPLGSP